MPGDGKVDADARVIGPTAMFAIGIGSNIYLRPFRIQHNDLMSGY
jgi:hypothetical protein